MLAWLLPVVMVGPGRAGFDAALVWGCAAAATAVTGWLWVATTVVTVDTVRGLVTIRRGVPLSLQRALLVLGGAALVGGLAAPAGAGGPGPAGPQVLAGLRLPERVAVPAVVARPAVASVTPSSVGTVEVRPGDTLWDLAARRLGSPTSWPRLYALNRDVIGPDPGLIAPGQQLRLPAGPSRGAR